MRLTATLVLLVTTSLSTFAGQKKDWHSFELLGRVRNLKAEVIDYSEDSGRLVEAGRQVFATLTFDNKGRLIKSASYATPADYTLSVADTPMAEPIDFPMGARLYRYGKDGDLSMVLVKGDEGQDLGYVAYSRAIGGREVVASHHKPDGAIWKTEEFLYDIRGNLIEYRLRDEKGAVLTRTEYKCDRRGNQIEELHYNVSGFNAGAAFKTSFVYDADGRLIEIIGYGMDGSVADRTRYRYNSRGTLISSRTYIDRMLTMKEKYYYRYDSAGNWIEKKTYQWSRLIRQSKLTPMGLWVKKRYINYY